MGPNLNNQGGNKNGIRRVTVIDALEYVNKVKKTFKETPNFYNKFLVILADFRNLKISMQELKDKMVILLRGHDDVLRGFNAFLPEEHKLTIPIRQLVSSIGERLRSRL